MFSRAPEVTMRSIRGTLALLWLILIVSLFWDPFTPTLTASTSASPFHLNGRPVAVQGQVLQLVPYAMGARIFWTMALPLVPVFLMLFGHEAWRRICPLSFFTQLPAYLGLQHRRRRINPATGRVEASIPVIARDSWLERNHWFLQFGFLTLGVMGRILFYNSNRYVLAGLFIGVISAAVLVGIFFGGKTWCQYICPVSVVQKIYTQPRGIFESAAHGITPRVSQAMCRRPDSSGDQSSCVACARYCPDIDLERHHWQNLPQFSRSFVYYGFLGLVIAFYTYYFWYAGGWNYYFSGAWTHENNQMAQLLKPGIWIDGTALPLPKLLAVPMYFALCIFGTFAVARAFERIYVSWRIQARPGTDPVVLRHHCLLVCAFVTFNVFYIFAGRPNLLLLPTSCLRLIDAGLLLISSVWLMRNLERTPQRYRSESLRSALLNSLKSVRVDLAKFLDGRAPEDLQAEEVYVLAKTLPGFSRTEKQATYKHLVREAMQAGAGSSDTLRLLHEVRGQLDLNDQEHGQLLEELGVADAELLDPERQGSVEQNLRLRNYRVLLGDLATNALKQGMTFAEFLRRPEIRARVEAASADYRISAADHAATVEQLNGAASPVVATADSLLEQIAQLTALRHHLDTRPDLRALDTVRLLTRLVDERRRSHTSKLITTLSLGEPAFGVAAAQSLFLVAGDITSSLAESGAADDDAPFPEPLREVLSGKSGTDRETRQSFREAMGRDVSLEASLELLTGDSEPLRSALSLHALSLLDAARASEALGRARVPIAEEAWMLQDVRLKLEQTVPSPIPGQLELMAWIAGLDMFSGVRVRVLQLLARFLTFRELAPGEFLCRRGAAVRETYLVYRGELDLGSDEFGRNPQQASALRPGMIVGDLGVMMQGEHQVSLRAGATGAGVGCISGRALRRLAQEQPSVAEYLLERAVGQLRTVAGNPAEEGEKL
jgi:hypothetical protein